jgi:hypothetical protein
MLLSFFPFLKAFEDRTLSILSNLIFLISIDNRTHFCFTGVTINPAADFERALRLPKHLNRARRITARGYPDRQVGAPRSRAREDRLRASPDRHTGAERDSAGGTIPDSLARGPGRGRTVGGVERSPPAAHTVHHSLCWFGPGLTPRRDLRSLFTVDRVK